MEFEWDLAKEEANVKKHGVSMTSFSDPNGFVLDDVRHSHKEVRHLQIGTSQNGRVLTTWFTYRGDLIRIIGSAEWRKFRRHYYERTKDK